MFILGFKLAFDKSSGGFDTIDGKNGRNRNRTYTVFGSLTLALARNGRLDLRTETILFVLHASSNDLMSVEV